MLGLEGNSNSPLVTAFLGFRFLRVLASPRRRERRSCLRYLHVPLRGRPAGNRSWEQCALRKLLPSSVLTSRFRSYRCTCSMIWEFMAWDKRRYGPVSSVSARRFRRPYLDRYG